MKIAMLARNARLYSHQRLKEAAEAIRNANDGVSMLQTAEGALGAMTSGVQRIRELALQAAKATLSSDDRQSLQAEDMQYFMNSYTDIIYKVKRG